MSHRLIRQQHVEGRLEDVFRFFKNPRNLEAITPPWLRFRVIGSSDREVRLGTTLRYRLNLHGIPLSWESRIAEYQEGAMFADEMLKGPYRSWYHRHFFRQTAAGVEIEDVVDYQLPLGPLGRVAHAAVVRRQLTAIFDYRVARITDQFPSKRPLGNAGTQ